MRKQQWPKTGEQLREQGYTSGKQWVRCKGCPTMIVFATTPNGKPMPLSRMDDGRWQPHWADCAARDQFKRGKRA